MSVGQLVDQSTGQVFALGFDVMTLGRHVDSSLVLADPLVSRHHAEIVLQGGRWVIRDLGSANGTYVNGQRISGSHVLSQGDTIRLGQTTLRFELPIAQQDTLVERLPPGALAAPRRPSVPWLAMGAGLLLVVAIGLLAAFVLWPALRENDGVPQSTSVVAGATATMPGGGPVATPTGAAPDGSPTARPTNTAIPTLPPPTLAATLPPPTAVGLPTPEAPGSAPTIGYFRSDRFSIEPGECARLEWGDLENANSVTLTGVGRVNFEGRVDVCLDETKSYTLQVVGAGGTTEETVEITVQASIAPSIEYLRVIPSIIAPGDCAELEWGKVEQATSASIAPDIGDVGTPGSSTVCPGGTTTYVLTARNPESTSMARTTLVVSDQAAQKPVIAFFTVTPANVRAGECTLLSWGKVDYAASVTIDQGIGGVATPGSIEICPRQTTDFIMTAVGPGGTTESRLSVTVSPGELADLPDLVVESILFEPNPCYRGQKCKVRVKVRNDGPADAGHFVVRWAPAGEEGIPVEWDVTYLGANQGIDLTYPWIPNRTDDQWWTLAIVDLNDEVAEIEEGEGNILETYVTVLSP